ncbi:hypothetical protein D3C75_809700 [compost metagenome]
MVVVQRLEVVQIDQQGHQWATVAPGFSQRLGGEQVEAAPVVQAGEAVERGQGFGAGLVAADHGMHQCQHHQGDHRTDRQVQVQRVANAVEDAGFAFVHQQVPVQFGQVANVEKVAVVFAVMVLVAAFAWHPLLGQHGPQLRVVAE